MYKSRTCRPMLADAPNRCAAACASALVYPAGPFKTSPCSAVKRIRSGVGQYLPGMHIGEMNSWGVSSSLEDLIGAARVGKFHDLSLTSGLMTHMSLEEVHAAHCCCTFAMRLSGDVR